MLAKRLVEIALLLAALSVLVTGCASSSPATPSAIPSTPTIAPVTSTPVVAPTSSPVATKPAAITAVPTAAVKPAGTPVPPVATPKAGRPALPAAGVIAAAQWGLDSAYVYAQLPTDQVHGAWVGKVMDRSKIQVLEAQVGWNAYPNETDGNVWYKVSYKDASGKDASGYVHASAVTFGQ